MTLHFLRVCSVLSVQFQPQEFNLCVLAPQLINFLRQGISLTLEQYNNVMSVLPQIEAALAKKGAVASRPDFSGAGTSGDAEEEEDESDEGGEDSDD